MARITHVKHAQQRYETVPVIDPATGEPKIIPVMGRNGQQRKTKRGRAVTMRVTERDLTRPLPPETCDYCREPVQVGQAYKWIAPKSGPYGGRRMVRHEGHPSWQVWEYSSSLSAQLARVAHDFNAAIDGVSTEDEVQDALNDAAQAVEEIADEKQESSERMEEGFGHATYQSDELRDTADQLRSWADEIRSADIPEVPDPEETDCEECEGSGKIRDGEPADEDDEEAEDCDECDGTGKVTPDDPTDEQVDEWRDEVRDATAIVEESPV
jgi:hypothetical protein